MGYWTGEGQSCAARERGPFYGVSRTDSPESVPYRRNLSHIDGIKNSHSAKTKFFLPTGSDIILPASLSFSSLVNAEEEDGVVTKVAGSVKYFSSFSKDLLSSAPLFVEGRR